jgi:WD40 repeat protein
LFLLDWARHTLRRVGPDRLVHYYDAAWSPSGTLFALSAGEEPRTWVEVWNADPPRRIVRIDDVFGRLQFSPDEKSLLCLGEPTARVIDIDRGRELSSFERGNSALQIGSWGPNSDEVVLGTDRGQLEIHHVWPAYPITSMSATSCLDVAWSPDGQVIAAGTELGAIRAWCAPDWEPYWSHVQLADGQWAAFSPGGKLLHASPQAAAQLVALIEQDDGAFVMLPWGEFVKRHDPAKTQ